MKIAFQFFQQDRGRFSKKKVGFISMKNSYHGDTIGSVSLGGIDLFHRIYKPLLFKSIKIPSPYCYRCEFKLTYPTCSLFCVERMEKIIRRFRDRTAAVVVEPIVQAAGGIIVWPQGILKNLREITERNDVFLIADEVATGFYRTGKMFACDNENITPDIMCVAKGISGGYLPIAATIVTDRVFSNFLYPLEEQKTFFHGHTYTANQLASIASIENIKLLKKKEIIKKIKENILFLKSKIEELKEIECVGDIRQSGFIIGIELVKDKDKKTEFDYREKAGWKVCLNAREYGILIRPLGNVVVLNPPLSSDEFILNRLVEGVKESIRSFASGV